MYYTKNKKQRLIGVINGALFYYGSLLLNYYLLILTLKHGIEFENLSFSGVNL